MGGKQQGSSAPMIRPKGPTVGGPSGLAGPPIVQRVVGPMNAQALRNQNSFKDTAAPIVGAIAGIVADYFAPGTGYFASKAADRTVREQVNVINGRPFFDGVNNNFTWGDLAGIIGSGAGSVAGAGVSAAGAAGGTAARAGTQAATTAAGIGARMGANYLDRNVPLSRRRTAPTPISGLGQQLPVVYGGY